MPRVDEILTKYGEMIENVLSGQGKVGAILRRGAIYDSLNAGRPSTVAAQPQYSPGLPDMSGAPQNANESLSDLMTFVGSLGSGAVGDPNEGVNWAGIDAQRANRAVDVQGLMDQRATQQAGMINESNLNQDQINAELGQAGADARIGADQVELGGAQLRQQEQSAVDDLLAQLAGQQEKRSMFDERLASDQQIAEMQFGNRPEPLTFEQRLQIAGRTGERQSKLLTPEEEAQAIRMDVAGRAPARNSGGGGEGRSYAPETFGAPFKGIDKDTGKPGFFRPGNRGSMKELDVMPLPDEESPSVARTAPGKRPGSKGDNVRKGDNIQKKMTVSEQKNTMHLGQMLGATKELDDLESEGMDMSDVTTQVGSSLAGTPMRGMTGDESQRVRQSQKQWSSAYLYARTGATATPGEIANNAETFYPQIGDGEDVVEQKKRARETAEEGVRIAAGGGAEMLKEQALSEAEKIAKGKKSSGVTKSGIKYKILE